MIPYCDVSLTLKNASFEGAITDSNVAVEILNSDCMLPWVKLCRRSADSSLQLFGMTFPLNIIQSGILSDKAITATVVAPCGFKNHTD